MKSCPFQKYIIFRSPEFLPSNFGIVATLAARSYPELVSHEVSMLENCNKSRRDLCGLIDLSQLSNGVRQSSSFKFFIQVNLNKWPERQTIKLLKQRSFFYYL